MTSRSPIESRVQNDPVVEHFRRSCDTLSRAADDPEFRAAIHAIAETIAAAFRDGHKLLIAGNGGRLPAVSRPTLNRSRIAA